nr:gamma-1-syntrophin-like [Anolis sagrei ordinatus]
MDFRTACEETKTGICLLQDGNQEPFKVRLHLAKDILTIQEQDVICVSGEPFYSGERTVTIRRQTVGGFGLSIKVVCVFPLFLMLCQKIFYFLENVVEIKRCLTECLPALSRSPERFH